MRWYRVFDTSRARRRRRRAKEGRRCRCNKGKKRRQARRCEARRKRKRGDAIGPVTNTQHAAPECSLTRWCESRFATTCFSALVRRPPRTMCPLYPAGFVAPRSLLLRSPLSPSASTRSVIYYGLLDSRISLSVLLPRIANRMQSRMRPRHARNLLRPDAFRPLVAAFGINTL